jgi:hypothetical protein
VNDVIGIVIIAQQLVADFSGKFSDLGGLIENLLPGRIGGNLMDD